MIRLSRLADYGVVLVSEVARSHPLSRSAHSVARATGVPLPTVSKLLSTLAVAGVLAAERGAKGGYSLAARPESITVADIVSAIDGPIALTQCIERGPGNCDLETVCPSRTGFHIINDAVRKAFETVSLADLLMPAPMTTNVGRAAGGGKDERVRVEA
jgi:FeS assembly SUF system regulator